jgi:hypothetical protein
MFLLLLLKSSQPGSNTTAATAATAPAHRAVAQTAVHSIAGCKYPEFAAAVLMVAAPIFNPILAIQTTPMNASCSSAYTIASWLGIWQYSMLQV